MKIQNNYNYYNLISPRVSQKPTFCGLKPMETIKHYNLGMMSDGIIGKVRVFAKSGEDAYLNVMKITAPSGQETYQIKDSIGRVIGEMDIKIQKFHDYDSRGNVENPNHVFVELLRNYSRPNTEYHRKGLKEYKQIGTRLLQIAQRRSDEALCAGNIKLHSKDDSLEWYKKLGFALEPSSMCGYEGNKSRMYLPPMAKEAFSKLTGGL